MSISLSLFSAILSMLDCDLIPVASWSRDGSYSNRHHIYTIHVQHHHIYTNHVQGKKMVEEVRAVKVNLFLLQGLCAYHFF